MHIRLKDYGRNQKKRKEYIHQNGLLIAGVNVRGVKYHAFISVNFRGAHNIITFIAGMMENLYS